MVVVMTIVVQALEPAVIPEVILSDSGVRRLLKFPLTPVPCPPWLPPPAP
jgi:hypothetical protein